MIQKMKWVLVIALTAFVAIFTLGAIYKHQQINNEKNIKARDTALINHLGKILNLPNEKPIIATVGSDQDFTSTATFRGAKKGDKIIIFVNSNQAVLYRPSSDRVIQITPVKASLQIRR